MIRTIVVLTLCLSAAAASGPDDAFHRLYNYDFASSVSAADAYIGAQPQDPMGHAARSATFLFSELHRLNLLGKEFMTSDDRIRRKQEALPEETARREFRRSADEARRLAVSHADVNSLLALTIVAGRARQRRVDRQAAPSEPQLCERSATIRA